MNLPRLSALPRAFDHLRQRLSAPLGIDPALVIGAARLVLGSRIELVSPVALARFTRDLVRRGRHGPSDLVHLQALAQPDGLALVSGAKRFTWRTLDERTHRLADGLYRLGVRNGDRVGVLLHNTHEHVECGVALALLGATSVEIGYRLKAKEVAYMLADSEARALVFADTHTALVEEVLAETPSLPREACVVAGDASPRPAGFKRFEDVLATGDAAGPPLAEGESQGGIMVYTSGTTGRPKGADRRIRDTGFGPILNFIADLPMRHDERHLVVCPLYHSMAQFFTTIHLAMGCTVLLLDRFDPELLLSTIERERITSMTLVPTMWRRLLSIGAPAIRRHDLSSLRWLMSGSAPLPTELAGRIEDTFGPLLYNFYGATESGVVTLARPGEHTARPGTIGRLVRGSSVRLLDPDGRPVPEGEVGEIWVSSRMVIGGYFRNAAATAAASREGFFSVGDLGRRDADGYYYLADRKHDMVISGGVNIYPLEIEQRLHAHPAVSDCAVVGYPDPDWGESLAAFVVLHPGAAATDGDLAAFITAELADFKRPRRFLFIDELPRNPTGKVLRRELRERLHQEPAATPSA